MTGKLERRRSGSRELSLVRAIVDDPALARAFTRLDTAAVAALVRRVGLEDSGSLLALATPAQLAGLADDDLWLAEPGEQEGFDAERFGIWLEVLLDEGRQVAIRAVESLSEELLTMALAAHLHVLDLDALAPLMAEGRIEDSELVDKLLESSLSHEIDQYLLLSKLYDGWDAIVEVLHELSLGDPGRMHRILEHLCEATMARVQDEGLHEVLSAAETLMEDARGERNDRREARGFVSGADARAFLSAADQRGAAVADGPVAIGFMRRFDPGATAVPTGDSARLLDLMREAGAVPSAAALPAVTAGESPTRRELAELREHDPDSHAARLRELVFLANVLVAGVTLDGGRLGRVDAIAAALTICDAGQEAGSSTAPGSGDSSLGSDLVRRFGSGWQAAGSVQPATNGPALTAARQLRERMHQAGGDGD